MSQKMTFQRNLICLEDLALGLGSVTQTRGQSTTNLTQINAAIFPYDANFTLKQKLDSLVTTHYVDADNLPVYIATPNSASDLLLADVIWIKNISGTERHVYYYDKIMFKYNPTSGDLILDPSVFQTSVDALTLAYIAADDDVRADMLAAIAAEAVARQAADSGLTAAFQAADSALLSSLNLGTAATKDVGTSANNIVQLDNTGKLPAVDGSQLTNLPSATVPAGCVVQRTFDESVAVTSYSSLIPRASLAPANTSGTELLSRSITPKATGNKALIEFNGCAHPSAAGVGAAALLFIDGVFVRGTFVGSPNDVSTNPSDMTVKYEHTFTDLDPVVVSVRVGPVINAGNIKFNDNSWGGTGKGATLVINEVKV